MHRNALENSVRFARIVPLAGDLDEDLVEAPPSLACSHALDASLADLGGKHRPKPMPPIADRLLAHIDSPFMQQISNVAKRQRETDEDFHRQAQDLGTGLDVLEWGVLGHAGRLRDRPTRLKPSSSGRAFGGNCRHTYSFLYPLKET